MFEILAVYVIVCCVLMYILLCGRSAFHRNGVVGWLQQHITRVPGTLGLLFCTALFCSVEKGSEKWHSVESYFLGRNKLLMLLYVVLTGGTEYFYFQHCVPMMDDRPTEVALAVLLSCTTWTSFLFGCLTDPGVVCSEAVLSDLHRKSKRRGREGANAVRALRVNNAQNGKYEHDGLLYRRIQCSTCMVQRPARSKHCRLCNHCVRRYDHHCYWLNCDVGEGNYIYFLAFLYVHCAAGAFFATSAFLSLSNYVVKERLWAATFVTRSGREVPATWGIVLRYLFLQHSRVVCVMTFSAVISVALGAFWAFHMWLAAKSITTNEKDKHEDLMDFLSACWSHRKDKGVCKPDPSFSDPEKLKELIHNVKQCDSRKAAEKVIKEAVRAAQKTYDNGIIQNFVNVIFPMRPIKE